MKTLIVIDMQNDFVTGVLGSKEAVYRVIVPVVGNYADRSKNGVGKEKEGQMG